MDILLGRIPDTAIDDLLVQQGDFVMGDAKEQDVYLIVRLAKGNLKQYPLAGFGEERLLNGVFDGIARKEIQEQLEADGIRVREFTLQGNAIKIDYV